MCTLPALIAAVLTACGSGGGGADGTASAAAATGAAPVAAASTADTTSVTQVAAATDASAVQTAAAPATPGPSSGRGNSTAAHGGTTSTDTTTSSGTTSSGTTSTGTTSTGTTTTTTTTTAAKRNSIDTIVSDVSQASELYWSYPGYSRPDGSPWTWESRIYVSSIASMKMLDDLAKSNGFASDFYDRVNAIIPGVHTAEGQGNRSTNTQVLKRNLTSYVLYGSTGKWVKVSGPSRPIGQIDRWANWGLRYGAQDELPSDSLARQRYYDPVTTAVRPQAPYESEAYDIGLPANIKDVVAWFVTFEAKLDVIDPNKPDDRDQAVYVTNAWVDFGDTVGQANGMPRYLAGGAPGHAIDGGLGRLKKIGKDWTPFNLVSMKTYQTAVLASPWAFPEWVTADPAALPPYALTEQQLRANPPPIEY